jgi:hypothetical protein
MTPVNYANTNRNTNINATNRRNKLNHTNPWKRKMAGCGETSGLCQGSTTPSQMRTQIAIATAIVTCPEDKKVVGRFWVLAEGTELSTEGASSKRSLDSVILIGDTVIL